MPRRLRLRYVFLVCLTAWLMACLASGDSEGFAGKMDPPAAPYDPLDANIPRTDVDLGDTFAIESLYPAHGTFRGGTRVVISGRGFSPRLEVSVGGTIIQSSQVVASSSTRAAVLTPGGRSGLVDVMVRDPASARERVLKKAFLYDPFDVEPADGATSGGTRIVLRGDGTTWQPGVRVLIGGTECADVVVDDATTIHCTTPPGSLGARDVTVDPGPGAPSDVAREAFLFIDAPDGYRGGLTGGALAGRIRVVTLSNFTGKPIEGAWVTLGASLAPELTKRTASTGAVEFASSTLRNKITVTAGAKCHSPITFVDVPVDTAIIYLDPVLDPACIEGDPGSSGGGVGTSGGEIRGEMLFATTGEFERGGFTGVPAPARPTERQAAYVFIASSSPRVEFSLPAATAAIVPSSPGENGYSYFAGSFPGNATLYALAGIEDRSVTPPTFTAYVMGVAQGIRVTPGARLQGIDIAMDIPIDHRIVVAPVLPASGPRGPDRLSINATLTLGTNAYAAIPQGSRVVPLPAANQLSLVGIPALSGAVALESFVVSASAATGRTLGEPASVIARLLTRQTNEPITLTGFLSVPEPVLPAAGAWPGTRVTFNGQGMADLHVVTVSGALTTWTIVAPGTAFDFPLPDLRMLTGDPVSLRPGAIETRFQRARLDGFSYGRLRYGNLSPSSWTAYAVDSIVGVF